MSFPKWHGFSNATDDLMSAIIYVYEPAMVCIIYIYIFLVDNENKEKKVAEI